MKIPITKFRPLLTLTFGCSLAFLPLGVARAQEVGAAPTKIDTEPVASPSPASTPAAEPAATAKSSASKLTRKEVLFIEKAGAGNAAEVKAGELAQNNAESQDVKDFAARMVKDHGDANTDLGTIATSNGITFPPAEKPKQKMMYEKLSKLHGAEFDKTYVKDMLAGHEKDLAAYKKEEDKAKDPDLKAYVVKTEAVVAEHLKMIQDIASKMGEKKS